MIWHYHPPLPTDESLYHQKEPTETTLEELKVLRRLPGVEFCVHAHNHVLREEDIFGDGVIYYGCSYMKDRNYLLITLTPGGYTREVVYY